MHRNTVLEEWQTCLVGPSPRGAVLVGTLLGFRVGCSPSPPPSFFLVSSRAPGGWTSLGRHPQPGAASLAAGPPRGARASPPLPSSVASGPPRKDPAAAARSEPNPRAKRATVAGCWRSPAHAATGPGPPRRFPRPRRRCRGVCVRAGLVVVRLLCRVPPQRRASPRLRQADAATKRSHVAVTVIFSFVFAVLFSSFFFPALPRDTLRFRPPSSSPLAPPPSFTFSSRPVCTTPTVRHIDGGDCAACTADADALPWSRPPRIRTAAR